MTQFVTLRFVSSWGREFIGLEKLGWNQSKKGQKQLAKRGQSLS
jgi:hypothetical protein